MNLRPLNDKIPLLVLVLLALIGIMTVLTYTPPSPTAPPPTVCLGARSQANAQRGAEVWLRNRPTDSIWTSYVTHSARVRCLPITNNEPWAECHIGPVDSEGMVYVVDCDTCDPAHNNIGCVSSR